MSTSIFHHVTRAIDKSMTTVNWVRFACFWGAVVLFDFAWGIVILGLLAEWNSFLACIPTHAGVIFIMAMYEHATARIASLEADLVAALAEKRDAWAKADRAGYHKQATAITIPSYKRVELIDKALEWIVTTSDSPMTSATILGWVNADLAEQYGYVEPANVAEVDLRLNYWGDSHDDVMEEDHGFWKRVPKAKVGRSMLLDDAIDTALPLGGEGATSATIAGCVNADLAYRYADVEPATVLEVEARLNAWNDNHTDETMGVDGLLYRRVAAKYITVQLPATCSSVDDYYIHVQVSIVGGTGMGEYRGIMSYDGATKVATLWVGWSTQPDATSRFAVMTARDMVTPVFNIEGKVAS